MVEDVAEGVWFCDMGGFGQEVCDYFGIGGGFEYAAVGLVFVAEQTGVYEIAVMGNSALAAGVLDEKGLAVD